MEVLFKGKVMIGEPSGTAGAPILNILQKKELTNVILIVTRYFGGVLLGTGGLVKAYSESAAKAIEEAGEIEKEEGYIAEVFLEYNQQREFEYICEKNNINIISKEFTDKVKNIIEISEEKYINEFKENTQSKFHELPIFIKEKKYITITK